MKEKSEIEWQAESVVRHAVENTPQFKKAVKQTMTELKKVQKTAQKTVRTTSKARGK